MEVKNGEIFPIRNTVFTVGEYADGYLGLFATIEGRRVKLRFTQNALADMMDSAEKNAEDFEGIEADKDCGLFAWIQDALKKLHR